MRICPDCFDDAGLQRRIVEMRPDAADAPCDLHPNRKGVPLAEVVTIIDQVIRENFTVGVADDRFAHAQLSLYELLEQLVGPATDHLSNTLQARLTHEDARSAWDPSDTFYSDEYGYVRDQYALGQHGRLWDGFRLSLLHRRRFFNDKAHEVLTQIFEGVHQQRNAHAQGPVYRIAPGEPQSSFYRARIATTLEDRKAIAQDVANQLGPPPERLRKPGRLNPSGVAALYAAFDFSTCVAELRPTVGSVVMGARFHLIAPIWVLDTTRFDGAPKEPNLFARGAMQRAAQWRFMQTFMHQIARPVSPSDEHLDYVATQAVAEHLRHHPFKFDGELRTIDAIIFQSAQRPNGRNIALLGDAAQILKPHPVPQPDDWGYDEDHEDPIYVFDPPPTPPRVALTGEPLVKQVVTGAEFSAQPHEDPEDMGRFRR